MKLAERLGMTVGALLKDMTAAELRLWAELAKWEKDQANAANIEAARKVLGNGYNNR